MFQYSQYIYISNQAFFPTYYPTAQPRNKHFFPTTSIHHEPLTFEEIKRFEEIIDIPYSLEPLQTSFDYQDSPQIIFTAREVCVFLANSLLQQSFMVKDCTITGGGARYILESLPFNDIDICYYLDEEKVDFQSIKECVIDFLLYKLSWLESKREQVQNLYLYRKKIFSDNCELGSYLGIGGIDLKFIYKKQRQSVSSMDGFQISFYHREAFCFNGEKPCKREEFLSCRESLKNRSFIVSNPESVFRLGLRLVHAMTQGFAIENRTTLAKRSFENFDIRLENISDLFKNHLKHHHSKSLPGKIFSLFNFSKLILEAFEDPHVQISYWQKLALSIKEEKQLTLLSSLLENHPHLTLPIISLLEGLILREWLLDNPNIAMYRLPFMSFNTPLRQQTTLSISNKNFSLSLSNSPGKIAINFIEESLSLHSQLSAPLFNQLLSLFINSCHFHPFDHEIEPFQESLSHFFLNAFEKFRSPSPPFTMDYFPKKILLSFLLNKKSNDSLEMKEHFVSIHLLSQSQQLFDMGEKLFSKIFKQVAECVRSKETNTLNFLLCKLNIEINKMLENTKALPTTGFINHTYIHRAWQILDSKSKEHIYPNILLESLDSLFFFMFSIPISQKPRLLDKDYKILHKIWKSLYNESSKKAKIWLHRLEDLLESNQEKRFCRQLTQRGLAYKLQEHAKKQRWNKLANILLSENVQHLPCSSKKKEPFPKIAFKKFLSDSFSSFEKGISENLLIRFSKDFSSRKDRPLSSFWLDLIEEALNQKKTQEAFRILLEQSSTLSSPYRNERRAKLFQNLFSLNPIDSSILQILNTFPQDFIQISSDVNVENSPSFEKAFYFFISQLMKDNCFSQAREQVNFAENKKFPFSYVFFSLQIYKNQKNAIKNAEYLIADFQLLIKHGIEADHLNALFRKTVKKLLAIYSTLSHEQKKCISPLLNIWKSNLKSAREDLSLWQNTYHHYRDLLLKEMTAKAAVKCSQFIEEELFPKDERTIERMTQIIETNINTEGMGIVLNTILQTLRNKTLKIGKESQKKVFSKMNFVIDRIPQRSRNKNKTFEKYVELVDQEFQTFLNLKNTPWKEILFYKMQYSLSFEKAYSLLHALLNSSLIDQETLALCSNLFLKRYKKTVSNTFKKKILHFIKPTDSILSIQSSIFSKIYSKNIPDLYRRKGLKYLQTNLSNLASRQDKESREEIFELAHYIQMYFRNISISPEAYPTHLQSEAILLKSLSTSKNRRIQTSATKSFEELKGDLKTSSKKIDFPSLKLSIEKISPSKIQRFFTNALSTLIPMMLTYYFLTFMLAQSRPLNPSEE